MKGGKFIPTAIVAGLLVAGLSAGQVMAGASGARLDLERFDMDGDGHVTRAEILEVREQEFDDADTSADGVLSADEIVAYDAVRAAQRRQAAFDKVDADLDGSISIDEFLDARPRMSEAALEIVFGIVDADASGGLDGVEFESLSSEDGRALMRFASLDRNGDGDVSEAEFNVGHVFGGRGSGSSTRPGKGKGHSKSEGRGHTKGRGHGHR